MANLMMMGELRCLLLVVLCCSPVPALDNGLGIVPQMGYSSWNDVGSMVTEDHMKKTVTYFIESGLAALGYTYMNVDEGWLLGRDAKTLEMKEDLKAFPSTMKGLGEWIHNQTVPGKGKILKYGLYTSRGVQQCDTEEYKQRCWHTPPNPVDRCEGSQGYEIQDAQWMVDAGADYIKEDSCGGVQTHSIAFQDYAKMRDALNASGTAAGRPIFFSLCGWEEWYAPPDPNASYYDKTGVVRGYKGGKSLGNSFRIHGDGSNWYHLSGCTNTMAAIREFSGPGGFADPDLLIGPENNHGADPIGGMNDTQARTQFNLWSVFPAPLLISQDVLNWSKYAFETYSNREVIAINQDVAKFGSGARLKGGDLEYPCTPGSVNCTNVWGRVLSDKSIVVAFVNNNAPGSDVTLRFDQEAYDTLVASSSVDSLPALDHYIARDLWSTSATDIPVKANVGFEAQVPSDGQSRLFKLTQRN